MKMITKKALNEEIEFIHNNRTNERLLRPLDVMRKVITTKKKKHILLKQI